LERSPTITSSQIPFRDSKMGRDGMPYAPKAMMPMIEGLSKLAGTNEEYDLFAEQLLGSSPEKMERGVAVRGRVSGITRNNDAMVDIGTKSEAKISYAEATLIGDLRFSNKRMDDILTIGEEYDFEVLGQQRGFRGEVVLTRKPFLIEAAWNSVEAFAATSPSFTATVVKANMGGVLVTHPEFKGLTGFVPGSMIANRPPDNESLVGTEMKVKFLQADKADQRIILSNRAVLQEEAMKSIKEHDLVTGTVAAIMNFGVFVDVMGVRGMIHVSQVSGLYVDPALMEKLFPIGGTVKAVATKTDFAKGKLALSTRILETTPGEMRTDPSKVFAGAEERHKALKEQWKLEEEARERERKELESQIMDLTMSVFDGAEAASAAPADADAAPAADA